VSYGYVWVPCKRQYGERGGRKGRSNVVRALKLGSKWSQLGGGKKLHAHTPRPRASSEELLFVCFVCLFAS
jgi:hypothetical protein